MREATRGVGVAGDGVPMVLWGLSIGAWCRQLSFERTRAGSGAPARCGPPRRDGCWRISWWCGGIPPLPPTPRWRGWSARGFVAGVGEARVGGEPQWVSILARDGRSRGANVGLQLSAFVPFSLYCVPAKGACLLCNLQPNRGTFTLFQLGLAGEFTIRILCSALCWNWFPSSLNVTKKG